MESKALGRRTCFRYLARDAIVWFEELCGIRHMTFAEIRGFPDEVFAAIVPQFCPGVEICVEAGRVCARLPDTEERLTLLSTADQPALAIFNRFNGRNPVGEIVGEMAAAMDWSAGEAGARVRALFLRLLELRVCAPYNDPRDGMEERGGSPKNPSRLAHLPR